jgi:nicotinamide mononucleotide transporter
MFSACTGLSLRQYFYRMDIATFASAFIDQLQQTSYLEWTAVGFSVVSVLLSSRNHVWLYPTGIVGTVIYIYLMATGGLYAESALNAYYLIMSIYGWVRWSNKHESGNAASISYNGIKDWLVTAGIVGLGWLVLYYTLSTYTDSTVPVWDAIVASTAWAGMWLLARHKIENWVLLNISNAIAIPLLISKGLAATAILTLILFIVAVVGYFNWRRMYRTQKQQA